jgi:DNA-binding NtrC family response regulator
VTRTLLRLSDTLTSEEQILAGCVEEAGSDAQLYLETIAKTQHSLFYHQLQQFYEFGKRHVPEGERDGFCRACGRDYMGTALLESFDWVLRMGISRPGDFRDTLVQMVEALLRRFAGKKYLFASDRTADGVVITLQFSRPEAFQRYLEDFDLDHKACFENSVMLIAGSMEAFLERVVEDYDPRAFSVECDGVRGRYFLPVAQTARFAVARLIPMALRYIEVVQRREQRAREAERLESDLIIASDLMRKTWNRLRRAARSQETVLLLGESGTGKSFIARKIHDLSTRGGRAFVEVGLTADFGSDDLIQSNLFGHERGAFTGAMEQRQGLFSLAEGGTIFLDEIGDASLELQAKLLRVVETGAFRRVGGVEDLRIDVRVVLATNRNLERMVEEGTFRRDLYFRINVIPIELPPLRDRRSEIAALADFLLARAQGDAETPRRLLSPELRAALSRYDWPGNIRELDHALRHGAAMAEGPMITFADLPAAFRESLAQPGKTAPRIEAPEMPADANQVIDVAALRHHIRSTPPTAAENTPTVMVPAHIDFAKRTWLAALIDECGGDLALISRYWDRRSEKTLRNLVRAYDLADRLAIARSRAAGKDDPA